MYVEGTAPYGQLSTQSSEAQKGFPGPFFFHSLLCSERRGVIGMPCLAKAGLLVKLVTSSTYRGTVWLSKRARFCLVPTPVSRYPIRPVHTSSVCGDDPRDIHI